MQFGKAVKSIIDFMNQQKGPINLLIEAPLSVTFVDENTTNNSNPVGRSFEKCDNLTRYWYSGAGCTTMVAAMYLIHEIQLKVESGVEIRLFEGFVTYKRTKKQIKSFKRR